MLDLQMPENEWMRMSWIFLKNGDYVERPQNVQRSGNFLFVYHHNPDTVDVYNLDCVDRILDLEFPERDSQEGR